nr:Patched domain containing protein [Haemonchus contortus]
MLFSKTFGRLGSIIGSRPLTFFIASLVVFVLSTVFLLILPPKVRLSFDNGYTTPDAPSIRELQTQVDFFGNRGKPWYMALFAEPRDQEKGSMIESSEFDEFKVFYRNIKKSIVIRTEGDRNITYMDYCANTCELNDQVFKTVALAWFGMQWPETSIFMYKSNIGKYFFLREMKGHDMVRSRLSALYFLSFINGSQAAEDLRKYEAKVADWVAEHNANSSKLTTITQHSARGMELEIGRGMKFVVAKLLGGVILTVFITLLSFVLLNKIHGRNSKRVAFLTLAVNILPLMALISAMALCTLLGLHANTLTVVAPTLAYAIGIDGALILYNCWVSKHKSGSVKDHMAKVFSSTFPSLTIVSSTAIGLLAGSLFPIEEFAGLSVYLGITILFIYIYQIFFLSTVVAWCSPIDTHSPLSQEASRSTKTLRQQCFNDLLGRYARCVSSSAWLKIFGASLFCLCLALPTYIGSTKVHSNIDYRELLPADSPSAKGVHFMSDVVWPEFFNVLFFIERPPTFDDPSSYGRFKQMISEIESLPGTVNNSGMMWINDFKRFTDMKESDTALNMKLFNEFITHDVYKAWNSGVRYRIENDRVVITRMLYIAAFENVRSMMDKAIVLTKCRQIAAKYNEFDAVPFDTEVGMVDVILQIPYVTYFIPLLVLTAYAIVSVALIGNLAISFVAIGSAVMVFLESYCISSLIGMILNPFSTAFLIVVSVFATKFSTHICYAFHQVPEVEYQNDNSSRLTQTLQRVFIPVAMSTIAGAMMFLPVLFTNVAVFRWLSVLNLCCLVVGVLHSLFLTPLVLTWIPKIFTGRQFLCTTSKKPDDVVMKSIS